jgi:hypothetical protein
MAVPIKPNIGTKTNYINRPSVPSSQKETATEFNLVVESIRANYERLILNWTTDIPINTTLEIGQYVLFTGSIYRITTSHSVGSPITWDAGNAEVVILGANNYIGDWDPTGDVLPTTGDGGNGPAGVPLKGDRWRLAGADYKTVSEGSTIEAAIDDPQDDGDWNFYSTQII